MSHLQAVWGAFASHQPPHIAQLDTPRVPLEVWTARGWKALGRLGEGGWGLQKVEKENFRKPEEQGCLELPGILGTIPGGHITWKSGSHSPSCQGGEEILRWGVGSLSWNNSPSPSSPLLPTLLLPYLSAQPAARQLDAPPHQG